MDSEEITPLDIPGLYYAYISLNAGHLLVSSALFFWRRNKFPVNGHNVYLTIFFGVAASVTSTSGSARGVFTADTCTPGTAVIYLGGVVLANVMAAQSALLWFAYNFAEAQLQNMDAEVGVAAGGGASWFYQKRGYFKANRLIGFALAVSVVETIVTFAVAFSSGAGFGEEFPCDTLLVVMAIAIVFTMVACAILVVFYRRLGDRRDGYGIKTGSYWICVIALVSTPVISTIDVIEGFTDLAAYVQAINESCRFLAVQLLLTVVLDRPVYKSFREAGHGGLSSVSQDRSREDGANDQDDEVAAVVLIAADAADADAGVGGGDVELQGTAAATSGLDSSMEPGGAAPAVFSSKTLSLSLNEILLAPQYAAQLASFAKHLVGEFNVEPLVFFFKVRAFQKYVRAVGGASSEEEDESSVSVQKQDSASDAGKPDRIGTEGANIDIAWRALMMFFEFLREDSPSQINVSHSISDPIFEELSEAIIDFRQLRSDTQRDDVQLRRRVDTKVFDCVQANVFELLERDPFVRWRRAIRDFVDAGNL